MKGVLLLFLFLGMFITGKSHAQQIRIRNSTSEQMTFTARPADGTWPVTSDPKEFKEFHVFPHSELTVPCQSCERFIFAPQKMTPAGGWGTGPHWNEPEIPIGSYTFRKEPHDGYFSLEGASTNILRSYFETATFNALDNSSHRVAIVNKEFGRVSVDISRQGGIWSPYMSSLSNIARQDAYSNPIRIWIGPDTTEYITCLRCTSTFVVLGVDNTPIFKTLEDGAYKIYRDKTNGYPTLVPITLPPVPPPPPAAPPGAAGAAYIVNAVSSPVSFVIAIPRSNPFAISLMAGEGHIINCPACTAEITTNTETKRIPRALQSGQSYMIVWDSSAGRLDFRTYSK